MDIHVLGPLEVFHETERLELPAGRVRELLLRLTVSGARSLSVERLIADLWPESGRRTPTSTVRTYIARLRSALPVDVVVTRVGGYALDLSQVDLDAERFEEEVRTARSRLPQDPGEAAELLGRALARWRGRAYDDVADRDWATATVDRLEEARIGALELEAEAQLAVGGQADVVAARLTELTRVHPLRERLWAQLMVALYRCGRQADALSCYQEVRGILADELGIEPGAELRDLERAILVQDPSLDERVPASRHGTSTDRGPESAPEGDVAPHETPAVPVATTLSRTGGFLSTTLVGRERERRELAAKLADTALVTVTGTAGVGKSRLAREVVADLAADHEDGVVTVELASVGDEAGVVTAVAAALGIARRGGLPVADLLREALDGRDLLLMLDNCEHVASHVARLVSTIADAAAGVKLIVTSREPIGVRAEATYPLTPLELPDPDDDVAAIKRADAVTLFEDRARLVSPDFAVDEGNAEVIARVCHRLDGLPFAIELAAARMRLLTPADLELRLDERFGLLTGASPEARHETLREAIAWSYELLTDAEQRAFRQLSLYVGSFDIAGATSVMDARNGEVIEVIASLIDRSLLGVERRGDRVRYRMLETLREYGREQLEAEGELVAARNRIAHYLADAAAHAGRMLHGPRESEGHALLVNALPDLRAAFDWCVVAGRWNDAARIVASVPWERVGRSVQWEVARLATRLVEEKPPLDDRLDALIHATATIGYWLAGDAAAARTTAEQALELAERADDQTYIETALAVAWVLWEAGDTDRAAQLYLPLADPGLADRVPADIAAYCLGGMVMGMTESGLPDDPSVLAQVTELTEVAIRLANESRCPAALAMAHLARAYSHLDDDPDRARDDLQRVADVEGLALPTWSLHARSHLARFRAAAGERDGLHAELADILTAALRSVDEMHLRLIGGFVGGALAVAGEEGQAPTLRPLAEEAFSGPASDGWRRDVARLLGTPSSRPPTPTLTGLELERAVRTAIHDVRALAGD